MPAFKFKWCTVPQCFNKVPAESKERSTRTITRNYVLEREAIKTAEYNLSCPTEGKRKNKPEPDEAGDKNQANSPCQSGVLKAMSYGLKDVAVPFHPSANANPPCRSWLFFDRVPERRSPLSVEIRSRTARAPKIYTIDNTPNKNTH